MLLAYINNACMSFSAHNGSRTKSTATVKAVSIPNLMVAIVRINLAEMIFDYMTSINTMSEMNKRKWSMQQSKIEQIIPTYGHLKKTQQDDRLLAKATLKYR